MTHEFCNSHYVSHFAAFFIDVGAETSTVTSCKVVFLFLKLYGFFFLLCAKKLDQVLKKKIKIKTQAGLFFSFFSFFNRLFCTGGGLWNFFFFFFPPSSPLPSRKREKRKEEEEEKIISLDNLKECEQVRRQKKIQLSPSLEQAPTQTPNSRKRKGRCTKRKRNFNIYTVHGV